MSERKTRRARKGTDAVPMTPMIDVVFLLLVFFLATTGPVDVFAHLDAAQPRVRADAGRGPVLRIEVRPDVFRVNDKAVAVSELERVLDRLAGLDATQSVNVAVAPLSAHERLIQVLDLCAKAGLSNLSVVRAP